MKNRTVEVIRVFRSPGDSRRGWLRAGPLAMPCALGRSGTVRAKREGDGGTPVARMRVLRVCYRTDRIGRPRTLAPIRPIRRDDGWCDDPSSRLYNRPIRLAPGSPRHEGMWREDDLYDIVLDLGWNRHPVIRGRGSAIFLHAARPGLTPTEGCVAVHRRMIARLVERIGPRTVIEVRA